MDTVEKVIYRLPDGQFEFVAHMRELVLAAHPDVTEKIHFNTPFFSCHGWLCYFDLFLKDHILGVGFPKGHLLSNEHEKLIARNRKVVRSLEYRTSDEFDEVIFLSTLREAIGLNLSKTKTTRKKKQNQDFTDG
jgi:hypothetical protein